MRRHETTFYGVRLMRSAITGPDSLRPRTTGDLLLIAICLLVLLAAAGAAWGAPPTAPETLDQVNRALDGKRAVISLASGETISKARDVEVGPEITRWTRNGAGDQVPTSEVRLVTLKGKRSTLKGLGIGVAAGALLGAVAASGGGSDDPYDELNLDVSPGRGAVVGAIPGGIVGVVVGSIKKGSGRIVYSAPLDHYLEAARSEDAALTVNGERP